VIPFDDESEKEDYLHRDYCGPAEAEPSVLSCQSFFDYSAFESDFNQNCFGKGSCDENILIGNYLKTGDSLCVNDEALFYFQYSCKHTNEALNEKRVVGLFVGCLGIFMSLVFLLALFYLYKSSTMDYKVWDVDTVTPADFTVEYLISSQTWDNFLSRPESRYEENTVFAF